jgi:hypothetical protein
VVKERASAGDEASVSRSLEALQFMDRWSAEECSQIAPWLRGFITHESNKVQGLSASLLTSCDGEPSKLALAWFDSAISGKRLTRDAIFAFGLRCHPGDSAELSAAQQAELAKSPMCVSIAQRVDRAAADTKFDSGVRDGALQTLLGIWPEKARTRAQALTKDADKRVAWTAGNVLHVLDEKK